MECKKRRTAAAASLISSASLTSQLSALLAASLPVSFACAAPATPESVECLEAYDTLTGARSAIKLQRAYRRYSAIKNCEDLITLEAVPADKRFVLVEQGGAVVYKFNAPALAAHFLCSGNFSHPVLRREVTLLEILRLGRIGLNRADAETLRFAFLFRQQAAHYKLAEQSLLEFMQADADTSLHSALRLQGSSDWAIAEYEDSLDRLVRQRPLAAVELISKQHLELIRQKIVNSDDVDIPEFLLDLDECMEEALRDAQRLLRKRPLPMSLTALGNWLQSAW
jgi:hypothetical protein